MTTSQTYDYYSGPLIRSRKQANRTVHGEF